MFLRAKNNNAWNPAAIRYQKINVNDQDGDQMTISNNPHSAASSLNPSVDASNFSNHKTNIYLNKFGKSNYTASASSCGKDKVKRQQDHHHHHSQHHHHHSLNLKSKSDKPEKSKLISYKPAASSGLNKSGYSTTSSSTTNSNTASSDSSSRASSQPSSRSPSPNTNNKRSSLIIADEYRDQSNASASSIKFSKMMSPMANAGANNMSGESTLNANNGKYVTSVMDISPAFNMSKIPYIIATNNSTGSSNVSPLKGGINGMHYN